MSCINRVNSLYWTDSYRLSMSLKSSLTTNACLCEMQWIIVHVLDTAFVSGYWGLRHWMVQGCNTLLLLKNLSIGIRPHFTLFYF